MVRWIGGTWWILALGCGASPRPAEEPRAVVAPVLPSSEAERPAPEGEHESGGAADEAARVAAARATLEAGALGQPAIEALEVLARATIADERERDELSAVLLAALGPVDRAEAVESHVAAAIVRALGALASASAVPRLVEALVQCDRSDVPEAAAHALVRIGRPAVEPLLAMLRGQHERARAAVTGCAEHRAQTRGSTAPGADDIVAMQASVVLGRLGFEEALDPLLAETRHARGDRRFAAAVALGDLPRNARTAPRIRQAITAVYRRTRGETFEERATSEAQLLLALHRGDDRAVLPFLRTEGMRVVRDPALEGDASLRPLFALRLAISLADVSDVAALRPLVDRPPEAWGRPAGSDDAHAIAARAALDALDRCRNDLACWRSATADPDPNVARKAVVMTARYGRGDTASIAALARALDHESDEVREEAYFALDLAAPAGDAAAVAAIDAREERERASEPWIHDTSRTIRSRLVHRAAADPAAGPRLARGRVLYTERCTTCHMEDGSPVPRAIPLPSRSLANLGRTEERMRRNLDAIGSRFRHPTASAEEWEALGAFLRQLGTLE